MNHFYQDQLKDILTTLYHSYNGADGYGLPIDESLVAINALNGEEKAKDGNLLARLYVALMEQHTMNMQAYGVNSSAPPTIEYAEAQLGDLRRRFGVES